MCRTSVCDIILLGEHSEREEAIYVVFKPHPPGRTPGPSSCPYSPKCVEYEFSEVRSYKLRRSEGALAYRGGAVRYYGANCHRAGRIRGLDSLRAVATCYVRTSRKFHQGVGQIPQGCHAL